MLSPLEVALYGLVGGLLRVLIGLSKQRRFEFNSKRALLTIITAVFTGMVAALLIGAEDPRIAIIIGFGGHDALDALYRGTIRKKTGFLPGGRNSLELGYNIPPDLNSRQARGLEYIESYGRMTNAEYRSVNRVSSKTAANDLVSMVRKGYIKRMGSGRNAFYILA